MYGFFHHRIPIKLLNLFRNLNTFYKGNKILVTQKLVLHISFRIQIKYVISLSDHKTIFISEKNLKSYWWENQRCRPQLYVQYRSTYIVFTLIFCNKYHPFRPVHALLSRSYADFILILSKFHLDKINMVSLKKIWKKSE